jgi:hypothetical protein
MAKALIPQFSLSLLALLPLSETVRMVRALAIFSTLAAFVAAATASSVPPDQAWQIVDTHTAQPDCLKATNRKCDVIDIAQVTQEGRLLAEKLSGHVHASSITAAVSHVTF